MEAQRQRIRIEAYHGEREDDPQPLVVGAGRNLVAAEMPCVHDVKNSTLSLPHGRVVKGMDTY
jgi:hypothetical protein